MEKTDLRLILSISGQRGLFLYIAQARNGIIAESLSDKKRIAFDSKSKITSLADVAIYVEDGELRLREVFEKLHEALGEADAPSPKASSDELKSLFAKAIPDYDGSRFYVSHMKKVVEWYSELKNFASLEFVNEEQESEAEGSTEK